MADLHPDIADVLEGRRQWCVVTGDCLQVLPTLPAECVDAVVTDPPYGISQTGVVHHGRPGKGHRNFDFFPNDSPEEACALALATLPLAEQALRPHGSGYVWCGHRQFAELTIALEGRSWRTRFLVWSKLAPPPPPPGSGWPSAAELCLYFFRPGRRWNHAGSNPPPSNVILADAYRYGQPGKVNHPTQKPLVCVLPLLEASSCPGDIILDPFCGSGTTGVACLQTGRRFVGIELSPEYAALARRRLEAAECDERCKLFPAREQGPKQTNLFNEETDHA